MLYTLKKKFGKGFFDEATTLEDELKKEQEIQKLEEEKNIMKIPIDEIPSVKVHATFINGEMVFNHGLGEIN